MKDSSSVHVVVLESAFYTIVPERNPYVYHTQNMTQLNDRYVGANTLLTTTSSTTGKS